MWLETTGEHLIGFIQDEKLEVVRLEEASSHHVVYAAGGTDNDVLSLLKDANILTDDCATNASVDLSLEVLSNRVDHKGNLHRELTGG